MMELESLLSPSASDGPAGPNLQYSPEYMELERVAAPKPARQVGGAIVPAEPPQWNAVVEKAVALLGRTKDLRVAVTLTRALLETAGFAGFGQGLALLHGMVERFWETLHPQLDPDDGNDPISRVNALAALTHRETMNAIRATPLVVSRVLGPISLRVVEAARNAATAPAPKPPADPKAPAASPAPSLAAVDAAFNELPLEELAAANTALTRCAHAARGLAERWSALLPGAGPDFTELRRVLGQAEQVVKSRIEPRSASAPVATSSPPGAPVGAAVPAAAPFDAIRSRDDVVRALDAICAYYAVAEPSSPVPLLLQRGRRLVKMSFVDILKEMLPDAVPNLQKIAGKTDA